jgi:DNA-binding PucR family transcriptional regulator
MPVGTEHTQSIRLLIAESIAAHREHIVDEIFGALIERIPELDQSDLSLTEHLRQSVASNVAVYLELLEQDAVDSETLQAPVPAMEYATRVAQRDISVSALNRAYHIGQNQLLRLTLDQIDQLDLSNSQKLEAIRYVSESLDLYIEWVVRAVIEVYETEKSRWWSNRATLNAAAIRRLLRGDSISAQEFLEQTRYNLATLHVGVITWFHDDGDAIAQQRTVDEFIRQLAALLRSDSPPLVTAADSRTAWAWISVSELGLSDRVRQAIETAASRIPGGQVVLGMSATPGTSGFIDAHENALLTQAVALRAPHRYPNTVLVSNDPGVGLSALLLSDTSRTKKWLHDVLGELAGPGEAQEQVRKTLSVFYAHDQNFSQTAQILGVHRNTVRRRVERFEQQRQTTSDPLGTLEIALALQMYEMVHTDHDSPEQV